MAHTIKTAASIAVVAFMYVFAQGVNKHERVECLRWQAEAREFSGYYLTSWQAEQCEAHGVAIDAPIIK